MFKQNLAYDPERIAHYEKRGIRELFFHGGNTGQETYIWLYQRGRGVTCEAQSVYNWPDEVENYGVALTEREYLELLSRARNGETAVSAMSATINGNHALQLAPDGTVSIRGEGFVENVGRVAFDSLFLDSLSIIENSEPFLRNSRTISAGLVEKCLLDLVQRSPELIHSFSPREFEHLVGAFLSNAGFAKVRLSRYVKDGGYDLWCVYCEGDKNYTVVVEVKHYSTRSVGLEIVDRLNGVRDRKAADKAVVFTSSTFTATTRKEYTSKSSRVALVDFQRMTELLQADTANWKETPSKLWTRPFLENEQGKPPQS